jgi:gamma-glutamyltranspeptidase / glutathione hydrolase
VSVSSKPFMVAGSDWFAATAGMGMLEAGGNAFDAAVAAGFVLQVVEPYMCGPGRRDGGPVRRRP